MMEDDDHQKQVFAVQRAAELLSTNRYAVQTSGPPCGSPFLSGFLIFFPKPMRLTVELSTLSQFWNSLVLTYFITLRDSAGTRMLGKQTARSRKSGE